MKESRKVKKLRCIRVNQGFGMLNLKTSDQGGGSNE